MNNADTEVKVLEALDNYYNGNIKDATTIMNSFPNEHKVYAGMVLHSMLDSHLSAMKTKIMKSLMA